MDNKTGKIENYLLSKYKAETTKSYIEDIEKYLTENPKAKLYHYKEIYDYITVLRKKYNNVYTIHKKLQSIKKYYEYLVFTKQRKDNPAKAINLKDHKKRYVQLQDLLSEKELETIWNNNLKVNSKRNRILLSLLIYQGLKLHEILQLTISDINVEQGIINIKGSINSNARTLKLKANQILLLHEYIKELKTEKLIVITRKNATKNIIEMCNKQSTITKRVNAQIIRQSVIRNLLDKGNDLRMVQYFAGHKDTDTTEKYKQTQVNTLQEYINKFHTIK